MTDSKYITREEFNGQSQRTNNKLVEVSERLVRVETQIDKLPELVYSKIQNMVLKENKGDFKWTASTIIIPIIMMLMTAGVTLVINKLLS